MRRFASVLTSLYWRRPAWWARVLTLALTAGLLQVPFAVAQSETAAHADVPKGAGSEKKAFAAARRTGEPVEILSQRGESRTVRALPNGRIEVEQHVQPIHARHNGTWADIDTTLRRSDGMIVPTATTVDLSFSPGGNGPMAQMTRSGRKLALSWPQALPAPTLDGDTAVYNGVAGPDVDLRLRALADGFSHVLVIKTAQAAKDPRVAKLALGLSTSGLSLSQDKATGLLTAASSSGAGVFEAPPPLMWDSSQAQSAQAPNAKAAGEAEAKKAVEEPPMGAKTAPIAMTVGDGTLTLTPDQRMLTASDTTFPVYIDPMYRTLKASSWGMVSSGWPTQTYYEFAGKSTEGVGRCEVAKDANCVKNQTKRLFYRMPLPPIKGRYVQKVEFIAYETSAYDCHNPASIELWRTSALKSSATWNNTGDEWGAQLTYRNVAYCSKTPVEFTGSLVRAHVQDAINKGHSTITFGLKADNESSMSGWKRFSEDAYLKVQYNNPPLQPDTDTMYANPGTKCLPSGQAKTVNDLSTLNAYLKDPDDEDKNKVQGQFTLHWANNPDGSDWGEKWTSALTPAKTTGSKFSVTVPSTIPQGTKIGWGVRAWDGEQYSAWSYNGAQTGCYFFYDPAVPGNPAITSVDYPADDGWHGGVGEAGTFTISDSEGVADRYVITLNNEPVTTLHTTAGAPQPAQIAPTRSGPNILTVQALAPSNQNGPVVSYEFNANTGSEPVAWFKLDEPAGATTLQAVTREGEPAVSASAQGGLTTGTVGQVGQAVQLDGTTGHASTSIPLIDTSKSFAVSAWVRLDNPDGRTRTLLSQDGENRSGFFLKYEPATQKWALSMVGPENSGTDSYQAYSQQQAKLNSWTHLVGVYDQITRRLRVYVNGEPGPLGQEVPAAWNATGGFQIGRSKWFGQQADHWPGQIDDVRVYDRIIGDREAEEMVTQHPVLKARWGLNQDSGADPFPVGAPGLVLHNGAVIDPTAGFKSVSAGGLLLGAEKAFAETATPPVWTDDSFTVAGWVRNVGRPQQAATIFSQPGANANAFVLRYMPGEDPTEQGVWQAVIQNSDSSSSEPRVASNPYFVVGDWVHLTVVYDALRDRVSLYVNGRLDQTAGGISQEDQAIAFKAEGNGGLQVGRNKLGAADGTEFWPDAVDDVWVYQGALTQQQVANLANDTEIPPQTDP
ncbi:LamG-like jellyroll fold domain-containing protein [Actinomadura meridiana]|uniref:LamG-like jellyroll fold domain-containing protein n=1 Tax=Actinomadura meridiana TaxID=559626 RepID=UPI0031EF8F64